MNKTLSVNIGGIVFHIEEQAYEKLNRYLDSIRGQFTGSDGRDEIMQDIEARLGEMFQEMITPGKQVITESDVENVITTMGRPDQFAEGMENGATAGEPVTREERRQYRRLYRDPDDRVIGGVCSGISHYLGMDPIWLRLIFAVALVAFGSGFLLYIILLIIMPKAKTTTEKLEMKGEKINLSNIRRSVEEEFGAVRSKLESPDTRSGIARFFDAIGELFIGAIRVIGKILAVFLVIIGVIILVAIAFPFLGLIGIGGVSVPFIITDLVMEPWQQTMAITSVFLLVGIPVIMLIYKAIKALFNVKSEIRVLNYSALALWIIGLILALVTVAQVGREFRTREMARSEWPMEQVTAENEMWRRDVYDDLKAAYGAGFNKDQEEFEELLNKDEQFVKDVYADLKAAYGDDYTLSEEDFKKKINSNTLYLMVNDKHDHTFEWEIRDHDSDNFPWSAAMDADSVWIGQVTLDIVRSTSDSFELSQTVQARGSNRKSAYENTKAISYSVRTEGNKIYFDPSFLLSKGNKYRGQKVKLVLKVPVGKSVYLSREMEDLIYDIKNVTNTYDGDMLERTWTMTDTGLDCVGCGLPDEHDVHRVSKDVRIRINDNDIKIDGVDDSGNANINIDGKDVKVRINDEEVTIDSSNK